MLRDVVDVLACPNCLGELTEAERSLRCPRGHAFDIAKQGYVSLLTGGSKITGDTAEMVAERARFLAADHYRPVAEAITRSVSDGGAVLDVGAGTGYYLAAVLDRVPESVGIALDASKYACRRAARAHPRLGAVVADAWRRLPVRTGSVSTVLNVFAPRNAAEMHRVLRADGRLIVVTPEPGHLTELVSALDLLRVDEHKRDRLDAQLGELFVPVDHRGVEFPLSLSTAEIRAVVAMGPSAWHAGDGRLWDRIAELPAPLTSTVSVTVASYRVR